MWRRRHRTTFSAENLAVNKRMLIFAGKKKHLVMSTTDYVNILRNCQDVLIRDYGITSMRLFGSTARGEQQGTSDVDVFVETETPNPFMLMDAKTFLEKEVGQNVNIVRNHKRLNPRLRQRIEHDGITVF